MSRAAPPFTARVVVCAFRKVWTRPRFFASQRWATTTSDPAGTVHCPPKMTVHGNAGTTAVCARAAAGRASNAARRTSTPAVRSPRPPPALLDVISDLQWGLVPFLHPPRIEPTSDRPEALSFEATATSWSSRVGTYADGVRRGASSAV